MNSGMVFTDSYYGLRNQVNENGYNHKQLSEVSFRF